MSEKNCQELKQKVQELKDLKREFEVELERVRKDGKPGSIYEIKEKIENLQNYLNTELKEFLVKMEIDISKFEEVSEITIIDEKIAFKAMGGDGKYSIILDGEPQGWYKWAGNPTEINGKLAFKAKNEDDKRSIILDGEPQGWYKWAGNPTEINGKL
ncbi:MAG: hypothetical protein ABFQ53_03045, partial [Patescibacteria group bacterium]